MLLRLLPPPLLLLVLFMQLSVLLLLHAAPQAAARKLVQALYSRVGRSGMSSHCNAQTKETAQELSRTERAEQRGQSLAQGKRAASLVHGPAAHPAMLL